ncbi:acetyl-CoA carboxylase, biotin carboxyl carrier protein [Synechococcus sp. PCC 7502]|uniref:acetyl-CoA carboxylase biotin carboxyl carrier protein n=1 Tax=Synechococcus sp. PCC 7502 TaxID=1173263 RepID=UPI00029FE853|nr:acetyl-CoA carboxylase biotin carboxyl carrier protein [Synechococcus sp. PCC 7502]AFY73144.1 acetyl-CoA carboxylase, biotin carboxyl carrier protein [Synechococcus sp. PCC 7502]
MELNLEELKELISLINQTDLTELSLEFGDVRLNIRKSEKTIAPVSQVVSVVPSEPVITAAPVQAPPPSNKNLIDIPSPMVGTFYRSPKPDEPPFVNKGDLVRKGQPVCIIEAMKLMNEIEADMDGRIVEILIDNAQPVGYGQVLMKIDPTAK